MPHKAYRLPSVGKSSRFVGQKFSLDNSLSVKSSRLQSGALPRFDRNVFLVA